MLLKMRMKNIDIELEQLFEEIKKHEDIWNKDATGYRNAIKRRNAWRSICKVFYKTFDDFDENYQNEIYKIFTTKWRHIKDNYIKNAKTGKRYIYGQQLSFLKQTYNTSNSGEETELKEELQIPGCPVFTKRFTLSSKKPRHDVQVEEPVVTMKVNKMSTSTMLADTMPADPISADTMPADTIPAVTMPAVTMPAVTMVTPLSSNSTSADYNADKSFFDSLLPLLNQFSEDQKLEFRCEVLQLLKRMRRQ